MSFFRDESLYFFPINLLTENIVFSGFVTACLFATSPAYLSSFFGLIAITEGVVLPPSEFSNTSPSEASTIAIHEFVVPKSIPRIFGILCSYFEFFFIFLYSLIK